ncbi:hypothetical protein SUGI_0530270 [Cryptomeria japonica]|uniref:photosystem II 5 kDa protein, chloroplastic n=1 Tax=Cryptomeria japonica TaxID=3369 RepID=UPI002408C96E|nr:photosystem II 5 kDa protein, chloroplastic [Cryptomeria japonica]GLJ27044.1 hypothetical protein SUGI_0530270 [Cryptomeria japonica]
MASLTVSAPCKLSSASSSLAGMKLTSRPTGAQQNRVVRMPVKAASNASIEVEKKEDKEAMQRRSVMFAAAAAAVSAVSQGMNAMAGEPKNGSPEAKKLYARICVTMPTAKVCRN